MLVILAYLCYYSTMNSLERVAIVVPFYNEETSLEGTLESLYGQQNRNDAEIILVDNGSTDSSRGVIYEFIKDHPDFPLEIIEESDKGTGSASDTGFLRAVDRKFDIIARTDADTQPRYDWIQNIQRHMAERTDLQLIGGITNPLPDRSEEHTSEL